MNEDISNTEILHMTEVLAMIRLSRTTLYRMCRDGEFPQAVQIGRRRKAWHRHEVEEWMRNLPRQ